MYCTDDSDQAPLRVSTSLRPLTRISKSITNILLIHYLNFCSTTFKPMMASGKQSSSETIRQQLSTETTRFCLHVFASIWMVVYKQIENTIATYMSRYNLEFILSTCHPGVLQNLQVTRYFRGIGKNFCGGVGTIPLAVLLEWRFMYGGNRQYCLRKWRVL